MAAITDITINNAAATAVTYSGLGASGDATQRRFQAEWADKSPGIFERWRNWVLGIQYPKAKGQMIRVRTKTNRPIVDATGNVIGVLLHEGVTYIHPSATTADKNDFAAQIYNGYNNAVVKAALTDAVIPS